MIPAPREVIHPSAAAFLLDRTTEVDGLLVMEELRDDVGGPQPDATVRQLLTLAANDTNRILTLEELLTELLDSNMPGLLRAQIIATLEHR